MLNILKLRYTAVLNLRFVYAYRECNLVLIYLFFYNILVIAEYNFITFVVSFYVKLYCKRTYTFFELTFEKG